jgi:glucokinase
MQERSAVPHGSQQPQTDAVVSDSGAIRHGVMLQLNEQLVLDYVHTQGTTTRPEISASLGLSAATVSRVTRRLIGRDLVREEPGVSTGGRPRTVITFNALSGCVIGIDLGGTKCHAMLADLGGELLVEEVRPSDADGGPFETLVESIARLNRRRERAGAPLVAVAVGVPAIVDPDSGIAIGGPNVHWHGFPLVSELRARLDVPFVVDNDVNLAALGHAWKGDARGFTDFVVLSIGTGIGAAVVSDGRLLKGRNSGAGEVGYMVLDRELLRAPRPNDLGSFETLASGVGVAELARQALERDERDSTLRGHRRAVTSKDVFAAASEGDALATELIDRVVDHVAMSVIGMGSVVDSDVVVLDGSVGLALGRWAPDIEALAALHLPSPPRVVVSALAGEATAIGAVAAALDLSRSKRGSRTAASSGATMSHRVATSATIKGATK